uniref:GATA transcription factor 11 n=1 Tax=Noccaea caerulescens TaxID=107243 RepID=A0A1J3IZS1_NOCCA
MNNGSWLPEEDFKGLSDNFFDDLINHIDFPLEDIETANDEGDWNAGFQNLVPPLDVLNDLSSEFTRGSSCTGLRAGVQKPVVKQSSSVEASSTVDSSLADVKVSKLFQSSSPVSVLENTNNGGSVSSQIQNRAQRLAFPVKGIRNKIRKRPTAPRWSFLKSFASDMSQQFAAYESDSETYLSSEDSAKKRRKKNKNRSASAYSASDSPEPFNADGTIRKCTHCETTMTPQWREGPHGPKTLCNACGVRYRSGRLVPEYRPASSPTFIPTVHSNSHRKIIEMRRKDEEDQVETGRIRGVRSRA